MLFYYIRHGNPIYEPDGLTELGYKQSLALVEKFKEDGLDTKSYVKSCIRQPSLFHQSPDTIEKNVKDLVEKFKDEELDIKEYLQACLKEPQLFTQSANTIEK